MYTSITFENFKIFKNEQTLEIRPITILFGKNNAGKSAILKLPLLLANSLREKSEEVTFPDFNQRFLFADIRDLVYGRATRAVKICVDDNENDSHLKFSFFVDNDKEVKSHVEHWSFSARNINREIDNEPGVVSFLGVVPQDLSLDEKAELDKIGFFVDYIGNIRVDHDLRDMRMKTLSECSGWDGEKGYAHLIKDSQTTSRTMLKKVSVWYDKTFAGWGIEVDGANNPVFHVNVTNGFVKTNIEDAGFGIIQSLPIVIRACRPCPRETLIVLEEPESHLHPSAQGNLGELIAQSALEDTKKRYLIETHSFNFILRIRSLIASGKLKKEDVAMYFVDYNDKEKSSELKRIGVDEYGRVTDWPEGFFEETYDEIVRIINAQQSKQT